MPDGHDGMASFVAPFACAEKVESRSVTCVSPQDGHATLATASEFRNSFSNFDPQSSQRYS